MLCWLEVTTLLTDRAGGRSAKRAPFWTRILWAIERSAMKTVGLEPMRRVRTGPYLATKLRRRDSIWREDLRSHRKLVRMGIEGGPGGSFVEVWKWVKMEVRREQREREIMKMNHISIFVVWLALLNPNRNGTVLYNTQKLKKTVCQPILQWLELDIF